LASTLTLKFSGRQKRMNRGLDPTHSRLGHGRNKVTVLVGTRRATIEAHPPLDPNHTARYRNVVVSFPASEASTVRAALRELR
jgi:hypothetical protein